MQKLIDLTNKSFGKWVVVSKSHRIDSQTYWNCVCECGTKKVIVGHSLRRGETRSCGCSPRDIPAKNFRSIEHRSVDSRKYKLKRKYGISLREYDEMLIAQGGVCAVCKTPPNGKKLSVDHNHTTGEVRKLLCQDCNLAIGWAHENPEILRKLANYLESF